MGRINLAALRVRKQAIQKYNANSGRGSQRGTIPNWIDVVADIPPAQVLIRQQPHKHPVTQIRTRALPDSTQTQAEALITSRIRAVKPGRKATKLFTPIPIKYEEDELRRQFFSDHPWELARPRVVLETTGKQWENVDWSRGVKQPGIPLSGESVIQRQLWLLQNTPDMTVPQSYDIARREFYMLRRAEETRRRIAIEEAEHMGAQFRTKALVWGMQQENKMYDDWEIWSKNQTIEQLQRNSAFGGESLPVEQEVLAENEEVAAAGGGGGGSSSGESNGNSRLGRPSDPFVAEAQRRSQYNYA